MKALTGLDVVFGDDADDHMPQWKTTLMSSMINAQIEASSLHLTVQYVKVLPKLHASRPLKTQHNGEFNILQIPDLNAVTGPDLYKDAVDATGQG